LGPHVFLSYSAQDSSDIARRVEEALSGRGAEVYRFENAQNRGKRFMREIPREIESADIFVALMSPAAEASETCKDERELAVYLEQKWARNFVYVFKVGEVNMSGWLATREWVDLTGQVDEKRLEEAIEALPLGFSSNRDSAAPSQETPFRNRNDELRHINDALTTSGDTDFWVVLSPPKLGKSWFLAKVQKNFETSTQGWTSLVDLRGQELDVRYSSVRVFCLLLGIDAPAGDTLSGVEMDRIVGIVAKRNKPQLLLLDGAELMEPDAAMNLRVLLNRLHTRVRDTPYRNTRLSVVVGTRRESEWTGMRAGREVVQRFKTVTLTGFGDSVIRDALRDTGLKFEGNQLAVWADSLHRMTAGLPALIVLALEWADNSGYASVQASTSDDTFDTVVKPYIEDDLLSITTLLPEGGEKIRSRHSAMLAAFRAIAPYRIVTKSHLKYHLERDQQLAAELTRAGWGKDDLWLAIEKSALTRPVQNPWLSQYPSLRQLLYRYFYRDAQAQRDTHLGARAFYEQWRADGPAGTEQVKILVESIWHAAMTMCCTNGSDIRTSLPALAVELTRKMIRPEMYYESSERHAYVRRLLNDDEELLRLTEPYDGLFDEVLSGVCDTIAGGG
jgi:hypothetical protein